MSNPSTKNVFVSIPLPAAVDFVQLRLQVIASDLELCGRSSEAPTSSELEEAYRELISLAQIMKDVEKEEAK